MVTVLPEIVTCEASPIAMVRVSPAPLLMTMFPLPAATASLNVSTMLLPAATAVALSAGVAAVSIGARRIDQFGGCDRPVREFKPFNVRDGIDAVRSVRCGCR